MSIPASVVVAWLGSRHATLLPSQKRVMSPALAAVGMSRFDPRPEGGGGPGFKTLEGRKAASVGRRLGSPSLRAFRRWFSALDGASS